MKLEKAVETAKSFLGKEVFETLELDYSIDDTIKGFHISKNGKVVHITYQNLCNLFRALTLVKEKCNEDIYEVSMSQNFRSNGLMIDCSRNGVVKLDQLKKTILILALMGENRLLLYTEDTYEMKKYPYFGFFRGAYSAEEIKEVVEYGESFGVTLVPCIQTLDHLERPLRWEVFEDIRDSSSNLLVTNEKSYEFITEMIKVSRECFKTNEIHIGMDESISFGLGNYLLQNGFHNRVELFCKHLDRVLKICKEYDFKPMIWSDMFFRLNTNNIEYYSCKKLPKETKKLIPEGVKLVYWDYYHDQKEIYDQMIDAHQDTGCETIFAGGSWRWSGYAPSLHKSFEFTDVALKSCVEKGVQDVFVTAWGDNGNECSIYTTLLSLAQFSIYDYYLESNDERINSLLEAVAGENKERMLLLDLPNMPAKKVLHPAYNPNKYFFYQDILLGLFDKQVKPDFEENYREFAVKLEKAAKESKSIGYVYQNLSNLCKVLSTKVDLGNKLRAAYKAKNNKELKRLGNKVIPQLLKEIEVFKNSLSQQWNIENKIFGYEVLDGRIGFLVARIESARKTINSYLKHQIDKIDELEKEVLPYNGHDFEICWNQWVTTVSPSGV